MEIADGVSYLSTVEGGNLVSKKLLFFEMAFQIVALHVAHEEINSPVVLEHMLQGHYERVLLNDPQNCFFQLALFHRFSLQNYFCCKSLSCCCPHS